MKRVFLSFSLLAFVFLMTNNIYSQNNNKGFYVNTVVIDAGHGGKDPGAVSGKVQEKDVNLAVAKILGNKINKAYPDVKVIYTRDKDVFVELHKRASITNKNQADLFISIHCNAADNSAAAGTETFVMGLEKSKENLAIAKAENAAILYEDDYEDHYDGYDPNSDENNIVFSLYQNAYLTQSLNLSSKIQNQFVGNNRKNRGVKQAPFLVLYKAATPSILTEIGFITNSIDRAYMSSTKGQEEIGESLFKAFVEYKKEVEANNKVTKHSTTVTEDKTSEKSSKNKTTETVNDSKSNKTVANAEGIVYKVQFLLKSSKIDVKSAQFSKLKDVDYYEQDGKYKYTTGAFDTEKEALEYRQEVIKQGYKDAFVVKFKDGKRIK